MKISPEEVGLFKKWKQEQGRSKKQLRAQEENYDDDEEEEDDDEEGDNEDYNEVEDSNMNKQKTLKIKNVAILGTRKDESDVDDSEEKEEEKEDDEGDYPEGVTEYDPPDSLHSCTDITMTDRLLERANTASKACARLRDEIGVDR